MPLDALRADVAWAWAPHRLFTASPSLCMEVGRASDDAKLDIGYVSDVLDAGAIDDHCGAAAGYVSKLYDQGPGADVATNAATTNIIKADSAAATRRIAFPQGGTSFSVPSGIFSGATAAWGFAVWARTSNAPGWSNIGGGGSNACHTPWPPGGSFIYDNFCITAQNSMGSYSQPYGDDTIFAMNISGGVQTAWKNGVSAVSNSGLTFTSTLTNRVFPDVAYGSCDHMALILFKRDLTSSERELVEGVLAWAHGLEANLPSGHPYKSAAP